MMMTLIRIRMRMLRMIICETTFDWPFDLNGLISVIQILLFGLVLSWKITRKTVLTRSWSYVMMMRVMRMISMMRMMRMIICDLTFGPLFFFRCCTIMRLVKHPHWLDWKGFNSNENIDYDINHHPHDDHHHFHHNKVFSLIWTKRFHQQTRKGLSHE